MILSSKETLTDYNSVANSLENEVKQWETNLTEELRKMVYIQLYNRIRREKTSRLLLRIIAIMGSKGLW